MPDPFALRLAQDGGFRQRILRAMIGDGAAVRQIYVPEDRRLVVQQWVENHHKARELMDELSDIYEDQVRHGRS